MPSGGSASAPSSAPSSAPASARALASVERRWASLIDGRGVSEPRVMEQEPAALLALRVMRPKLSGAGDGDGSGASASPSVLRDD